MFKLAFFFQVRFVVEWFQQCKQPNSCATCPVLRGLQEPLQGPARWLFFQYHVYRHDPESKPGITLPSAWNGMECVQAIKSYLQVVKAPGNLVISAYVTCPDITLTVTPDLKLPNSGRLVHIDLGRGARRLGGSALVHAYSQVSRLPRFPSRPIFLAKYDLLAIDAAVSSEYQRRTSAPDQPQWAKQERGHIRSLAAKHRKCKAPGIKLPLACSLAPVGANSSPAGQNCPSLDKTCCRSQRFLS